jgi:UDP-N-acetylmuramoyl-L-alanyl-D-glutamate--2,6-diaminopimelate ligase
MDVSLPGGAEVIPLKIPFTGRYNASNALGAISAGYRLGLGPAILKEALETLRQVPGRLERIAIGRDAYCIIDYAHSPDALENVLQALKEVTTGRLWAVFGLGGERYEENRPAMGQIAARLADRIIITMDNPRSESPAKIAEQIAAGIESVDGHPPYRIILDRSLAVGTALDEAETGDAVMVGGKGPETYMIIGDKTLHYNDRETVLDWLEKREKGAV